MEYLVKIFRHINKSDYILFLLTLIAFIFILILPSCGMIQQAIDSAEKLQQKIDEYGPAIKKTAGQIAIASKKVGEVASAVKEGYDKVAMTTKEKISQIETQLKIMKIEADKNKDGKVDFTELLQYLLGLGGVGAISLFASKKKEGRKRAEIWAELKRLQSGK